MNKAPITIEFDRILIRREKSFLFLLYGKRKIWLPLSKIDIIKETSKLVEVEVPFWLAYENGLI